MYLGDMQWTDGGICFKVNFDSEFLLSVAFVQGKGCLKEKTGTLVNMLMNMILINIL